MFGLNFLNTTNDTNYQDLVNEIKSKTTQLVDIREKKEWQQGRFNCAVNIPLSEIQNGIGIKKLLKYDSVSLHCRTGHRVKMADRILKSNGINHFSLLDISIPKMIDLGLDYQ
ncbi:MAG: rhodanese-like domain-containing protein [Flavobacteriaceae bacterium]|nr:rhodanese-like domain-containing protein [Flavobacteriaceae bacterium]